MPVQGTDLVANNIKRYGGGFLKHVNKTMREMLHILDMQVTKNMSRTDFSLKQLADMDHPFASRHGSQGIKVYDPDWMIHKRSGKLLESKYSGTIPASIESGRLLATAFIGLDEMKTSYAPYIVFGTSKMIPRPVLHGSLSQVQSTLKNTIKTNLRDLTINFR